MRKFIIFFTLICSSIFIEAQNNLVFNQVLDFSVTLNSPATVPQGKVWKVEYITPQSFSGNNFRVNNSQGPYGLPLSASFDPSSTNAIWFSEGTVLSSNAANQPVNLSVIEFNVVPISETSSGSGGGLSSEGLEFNQVINYTIRTTVDLYGGVVDNIVIPEGKVWKITSVSLVNTSNVYPNRLDDVSDVGSSLGGITIFYRPSNAGYSTSSYDNFPIWINSGAKDLVIGRYATTGGLYMLSISAIEYNIP